MRRWRDGQPSPVPQRWAQTRTPGSNPPTVPAATSAPSAAPRAAEDPPSELTPYGLRQRPNYAWRWRQILSPHRIGGKITTLAVDERNPNRIFVGTEEYRFLRSLDGGVTWDEIDLSPFTLAADEHRLTSPGLPRLGEIVPMGFFLFVDPPYREDPANRLRVEGNIGNETFWNFGHGAIWRGFNGPRDHGPGPYERRGRRVGGAPLPPAHGSDGGAGVAGQGGAVEFIRPTNVVVTARAPEVLLDDAIRPKDIYNIVRIRFCPGAAYPLMIASRRELLGSTDDGHTWVRLLRLPGVIQVNHIACGEQDSRLVIAATTFGPFLSFDGGITWSQDLSGWPGRDATAATFDPRPGHAGEVLVATGADLFMGDPRSREGLEWVYPDFNNSATLPWQRINYVSMTPDGVVWLATDDGVRVSRDGGNNWQTVSRGLLSRQKMELMEVGVSEIGTERVAAVARDCRAFFRGRPQCRGSLVYATDDGGQSWFPFFDSMTGHTVTRVVNVAGGPNQAPRWWVLTDGGLFSTVDPTATPQWEIDRETQAWARNRLLNTPPRNDTVHAILDGVSLTEQDIIDNTLANRRKHFAPELHLRLEVSFPDQRSTFQQDNFQPYVWDSQLLPTIVEAWVFLQWRLKDVGFYGTNNRDLEFPAARTRLWALRNSIKSITNSVWHERRMTLERPGQRGKRPATD